MNLAQSRYTHSTEEKRMFQALFSEEKTAHAVAYMLSRAGGSMELLKLMKLMYLSERLSYEEYGEPMTGDMGYSMAHGPVLSHAYKHVGSKEVPEGIWAEFVAQRDGNDISLREDANVSPERLKSLSRADMRLLDVIWGKFGHMTGSQLRKYTHDNCPEYEDPTLVNQKRKLIRPVALLKAIGFSDDQAMAYLDELRAANRAQAAFHEAA
jgi:uncharacterized phage-associated protein